MAFSAARRSLATSLSHHLTRRLHPSLSHLLPSHHDRRAPPPPTQHSAPPFPFSDDLRRRSRSQTLALPLPFGAHRSFSTASEVLSDAGASGGMDAASGVLSESAGPGGVLDAAAAGVLSESARPLGESIHTAIGSAAADWLPTVAALQHVLEAVHAFTGLNWWISIVLTSVLIKTSMHLVPLLLKSTMLKYKSGDPRLQEGTTFGELFRKYGVNPPSPKVTGFIKVSIDMSFFFAILNMVGKVPSLEGGGAYWFTDLTTRDHLYILPALASITFLAIMEPFMRHAVVDTRTLQKLKAFRILTVVMIPFITFPKAVFFHVITCNWFSLGLTLARQPAVRSYYLNLLRLVPRRVPAQVRPPSDILSRGTMPMPAGAAVKGSEQSSSEPSDHRVEKKRRIPSVVTNRAHGESSSSDGR